MQRTDLASARAGHPLASGAVKIRRGATALLLAAAALVVGASPAGAHSCLLTQVVSLNQASNIKVVVAIEATPIPDVEFTFPPGLHLDKAEPRTGGNVTVSGQTMRYQGAPLNPYSCQYFNVTVTAANRGAYPIGFVQRDANGRVVAQATATGKASVNNPYIQQTVYAGMKPPGPPSSGGPSAGVIAGAALIAVGVVAAFVLWLRNRRARKFDEREEEIDERVAAFKSQARDRQPEP